MHILFYLSALIALFSTVMVVMVNNAVHALLYLVVSLFSVAVIFFTLGATFAGTLEIIVYAGAIMVLFIFVVMLLNIGPGSEGLKNPPLRKETWMGPFLLCLILAGELIYIFATKVPAATLETVKAVTPKDIGIGLFTTYPLSVEMASMLLLGGLVGAYHIGRRIDHSKVETKPSDDNCCSKK